MENIPNHLGIIMDGNRRWAEEKKLPIIKGHEKGSEVVKQTAEWCRKKGVKILTLFVFSTENWNRPKKEVNILMSLLKKALDEKNMKNAIEKGMKIKVIGEMEKLSASLQKKIEKIENLTKNNKEMILNFAISYGGRAEIVSAIKKIIEKKIPAEKITENMISQNLWTSDLDLIIRTGKEQRISNFLIWQAAYSELYFWNKYWPDFTEKDLNLAFQDYANRKRRFGK
jgi:undecaprenyl diphosphate synthase